MGVFEQVTQNRWSIVNKERAISQKRNSFMKSIIPLRVSKMMAFNGKVMVSPPFLCPPSNPPADGL